MCKAIEDMITEREEKGEKRGEERGRKEGEEKGRIEGRKDGEEMAAREFVSYLREQSFPEDKLQDFLGRRMKFSPEQIANLCAMH